VIAAAAARHREPVSDSCRWVGSLPEAYGVFHGSELPFVFGSVPTPGANDLRVIATFGSHWARLAAFGDSHVNGSVAWPSITTGSDTLVTIDATVTADSAYRNTQCDFWASLVL